MKRLYKDDFGLNVDDPDIKEFADLAQKAGKKLAKFAKSRDLDLRDAEAYAGSKVSMSFVLEMLNTIYKRGETKCQQS